MKKSIFFIALFFGNAMWGMKIEKYSPKTKKLNKISTPVNKNGWEIVRDINQYTGILPNKTILNKNPRLQNSKAKL
ncbi:MAG TPA: hypothetical protein VHX42_01320 [Candidatus Babeliales bacterium]|jgi:hypothetical protein|nr:hypothetical protein [Candidatus Babeliales bacterium]